MVVGLDERSVGGEGLAVEAVVARADGRSRPAAGRRCRSTNLPIRRSARSCRRPTGTSVRRRTCSGSSRSAIQIHAGLSSTSAGRAATTPSARTSRRTSGRPMATATSSRLRSTGEGVYQLPVGPIHAGIIEPGHFRFSAVGERVLHLDARLFFTHRGLEKLVEGRSFGAALPIVERACGVCTVTHAMAYSQAVETLTGTAIPERARWARVLLAELERLYNHVGDLGNICAGIGFQPAVSRLGWLKERLLRANDALTGHRYLTGIVAPGGLLTDLDPRGLAALPRDARCNQRRAPSGDPVDPSVGGRHGPVPWHRRREHRDGRCPRCPWRRGPGERPDARPPPRPARTARMTNSTWRPSPPPPGTSRRASTSAPRRLTIRSGSSARPPVGFRRGRSAHRSRRHPRLAIRPLARPRGRAERRGSGYVRVPMARSTGCASDRRRSPTGRSWPRRLRATSCPISR